MGTREFCARINVVQHQGAPKTPISQSPKRCIQTEKFSALLRAYDNVLLCLNSSSLVSFVFRLRLKMAWRSAPAGGFARQWNPLDVACGRIFLSCRDMQRQSPHQRGAD